MNCLTGCVHRPFCLLQKIQKLFNLQRFKPFFLTIKQLKEQGFFLN